MAPQILAVRHGQSVFNVKRADYASDDECNRAGVFVPDCDVTELGIAQSRQAGGELIKQLQSTSTNINKVHFVISPLRRALQTAQYMLEGAAKVEANWKPSTIIVQPLATEVMIASCDIGTPVPMLQQEFPTFDMTLVAAAAATSTNSQDGCWWPFHRSVDETWERMRQGLPEGIERDPDTHQRLLALKDYLRKDKTCQQADVVVVVCHSDTIWWLTKESEHPYDTSNGEIVDLTTCIFGSSK